MNWLVRFVITLLSHIIAQGRFIPMLTDRADVISLSPKFSTPKHLLDFRHLLEGGGPRCLDSLMGGISSDSIGFFLEKHQAASANG